MKLNIKTKYLYILILMLVGISFMEKGYSTKTEEVLLVECEKSSAYLEWEKLSDEAKEITPMPAVCDSEKNNTEYLNFTFSVKGNLPSSYSNKNTSVKDQMSTGQCWAFSTTTILESYIKKVDNLTYEFSPRHIEYSATRVFLNGAINEYGYNRTLGSGGHFYMSSSYLINHLGPISEKEMPFENNENPINISNIQNKNVLVDVNDVTLSFNETGVKCSSAQIEEIKDLIYKNGAVATTTYFPTSTAYYNKTTAAAYYNGTSGINHAIVLIGWDDNYSKNNFSSTNRPQNDGAWLVQNSYGTDFGKDGYYYLSYEDVHTCDFYMAINDIDYEIEDNSYILDKLGLITFSGYQSSDGSTKYKTAYAMNVFTKEKKLEQLKEITFGSDGTGTYTIYYMEGKGSTSTNISDMQEIGSGNMSHSGYITHKLDQELIIGSNVENFTIAIFFDMDTSVKPIPLSTSNASKYEYLETTTGVSYTSFNGTSWSDLGTRTNKAVASIKAYTDDVEYSLNVKNSSYNIGDNDISIIINTNGTNINTSKLDIYVKDKNNSSVTPTNISYTGGTSLSKITLTLPKKSDTYKVLIYYKDNYVTTITKQITISTNIIITSSKYTIDQTNKIIYVQPKTIVSSFLGNITGETENVYNGTNIVSSGYVATAMKINSYTIVVKGDVTGDGLAKMNDVMKISKYIVEKTGLTGIYLKSADVTNDNNIRMNDVMKISKYIVEGGDL